MSHWLLDRLNDTRQQALKQASRAQIHHELLDAPFGEDAELIRRSAEALEMVVLDLVMEDIADDEEKQKELKLSAADAFRLLRVLPRPDDAMDAGMFLLRAGALAVLGDKGSDAARWLREESWPELPLESEDWSKRTWATILDIWLRLIRKNGWSDRDTVLERISCLRDSQASFEKDYFEGQEPAHAKATALELIGLYHLAKAAEVFAYYMTDGVVDGRYQIHKLLETHFDRVLAVCKQAQMVELEPLSWLLAASASQMADNSIWTVTRAVNSRVTEFVKNLVDRGRGDRTIFDMLPPQRRTLAEKGLLGSSRRAVVVSLPTSSGKTLIAEFRILQALNQFDHERGWVAYLAPTRTLVNQIARQLRHDFEPLNIIVEKVSPALEINNIEAELLHQRDPAQEFRVLVTTPEKLDLMLRQGREEEIGRPLTLVVVDEAHNIQSVRRGLKLELLLATINSECQHAQFLLLTPFINNAREVARWLGGQSSEDISLALDWQPNDRVIGIVQAERGEALNRRSYDYQLRMETVHTTRHTLVVDELLTIPKNEGIAPTYSKVSNPSALAAVAAQKLQERGPVIVMHTRPDWVWTLAERLKIEDNRRAPSQNIELVQEFLEMEFGSTFPLIDLLSYGVGIHHAGLSDDVRTLMEWLFEADELKFLVATTTIAQGVNFPVTGVVMASHQYPYGVDMPPEDFWNIAGRAGRISQGSLGVVALVADNQSKAEALRTFIQNQSGELNSALITLAREAGDLMSDLGRIVYRHPEWSTFVQYLVHTYRQMGQPEGFADEIEQVLRGTFGFEKLRTQDSTLANLLLEGIHSYTQYLQQPGQPLKLVDSTGFSLQSIRTVLGAAQEQGINESTWNADSLFSQDNHDLQGMMGVLLQVPELRENLQAATGGQEPDGDKLALIVKDWVNGVPVPDIASRYFMNDGDSLTKAMTVCGKNLFGKLTQTTAWGIGAMLSITGSGLSEAQFRSLNNLPSCVYYGVNDGAATALRLLGVPREAATELARTMDDLLGQPLTTVRTRLREMDEEGWREALGQREGRVYQKVWRVLEGLE
ncbi:MAG: DEAD/DEAH box helicase [Euryarchaeota archaeon]|nr:DEAD/DEAH box helicase [Euryarchaeota archaeon]